MYKFIVILIGIMTFLVGCKQDNKTAPEATTSTQTTEQVAPSIPTAIAIADKFESSALANKGGQDVSKVFTLKQDQFLPEYDNGFNFKSKKALEIYANGSENNVDFDTNEAIGVFLSKTNKETIFKVESVNFDAPNGPEILITTSITDKEVPTYRPSFIMAVPKNMVKGYPTIMVNATKLPITTIQ